MSFKTYFEENIHNPPTTKNWQEILEYGIQILKSTGKELSGGNCGMTALAIYKWLTSKTDTPVKIALITNVEEERELLEEPDVYHVFFRHGDNVWDENGKGSLDDMIDIAAEQYNNYEPMMYTFDPKNQSDYNIIETVIRRETNWNISWQYFYKFLTKKDGEE